MAKKRRDKTEQNDHLESADDRLGKMILVHCVNLAGALIGSGTLALIGLGVLGYALVRQSFSLMFLLAGVFVLILAAMLLGINVFNVGRRLELRKRGVRFVESGIVTEFFWAEIVDIEVKRSDNTNMGLVRVHKRSSDAVSPSGPFTKTEWHVTLHADDGRTIRLTPTFMRIIPDPKKLISQLRLRSGVP
jgi:hypothetical protein